MGLRRAEPLGNAIAMSNHRWVQRVGTLLAALALGSAPSLAVGVTFEIIAATDFLPPDAPEGATAVNPRIFSVNELGQFVLRADIEGPDAGSVVLGPGPGGRFTILARVGAQAPDLPPGEAFEPGLFDPLLINDAGLVLFTGRVGWYEGYWGTDDSGRVRLLAGAGTSAPGVEGGGLFSSVLGDPRLNERGELAFHGYLQPLVGGVTYQDNEAIWGPDPVGSLTVVAREGYAAPGAPPGVPFVAFDDPDLNDAGQVAFRARLDASGIGGVNEANDSGLWGPDASGGLSLLAREGDDAPGAPAGARFRDFRHVLDLNDTGEVAFQGSFELGDGGVSSGSGIWKTDGAGGMELVVRTGDPAPGGPTGSVMGGLDWRTLLNDHGEVAFLGSLAVGTGGVSWNDAQGIWGPDGAGELTLRVREGDPLPGGAPTAKLIDPYGIEMNDLGDLLFWAEIDENGDGSGDGEGLFLSEKEKPPILLVRDHDRIEVAPGDVRSVYLGTAQLNDSRQVALSVEFVGSDGAALLLLTVPEPSARMLQATALSILVAVAAVARRRAGATPAA
jgi:hypothetical protein